jgi:hypothetical protein
MAPHRQYAKPFQGIEVIEFSAPALAYITNLRFDSGENVTYPRIWFTADKASSNAYFAQFDPAGGNHSFWSTASSPFPDNTAAPFIAFDVDKGYIGGIAASTNYTQSAFNFTGFGPVAQGAYVSYDGLTMSFTQNQYPDYFFAAVEIDPNVLKYQGGTIRWIYSAGWATDAQQPNIGFTIARMQLGEPTPDMDFDPANDAILSDNLTLGNCYDIYTDNFKPFIFVHPAAEPSYQIFVIPGRCSLIYKTVPQKGQLFKNANVTRLDPFTSDSEYISSAALDESNHILWFVVKTYQQEGAVIRSLNVTSFTLTSENTAIDFGESEPIIAIGNDLDRGNLLRYLFVAASGGSQITRFKVKDDGTGVTSISTSYLPPRFSQISSMVYVRPYIYFGTYEPDAQLARVPKSSFCGFPCQPNSYCLFGVCTCFDGYSSNNNQRGPNGQLVCLGNSIQITQIKANKETGAAAALGILWAFSLVVAIAGWYLWWKARAAAYSAI